MAHIGDASSTEVEVGGSGIRVILRYFVSSNPLSYFVSSNQSDLKTLPNNPTNSNKETGKFTFLFQKFAGMGLFLQTIALELPAGDW